jgi:hypothetical protein
MTLKIAINLIETALGDLDKAFSEDFRTDCALAEVLRLRTDYMASRNILEQALVRLHQSKNNADRLNELQSKDCRTSIKLPLSHLGNNAEYADAVYQLYKENGYKPVSLRAAAIKAGRTPEALRSHLRGHRYDSWVDFFVWHRGSGAIEGTIELTPAALKLWQEHDSDLGMA